KIPDAGPPGPQRPRRSIGRCDPVARTLRSGGEGDAARTTVIYPQLLPASFALAPVAATTSRTRSNTPSASGGQFGDRPSRTITSRSEGTMITYWPIVPLAKNASRGQPRSVRYVAPKLSPRLVQKPAPWPTQAFGVGCAEDFTQP